MFGGRAQVPASRRTARLAAAAVATLGVCVAMVGPAGASTLTPCPKPPPPPRFDGEGTLVTSGLVKKALRRHGVRQTLISPANAFTGRPTFPLKNAGLAGQATTVSLEGGLRLGKRKGAVVRISSMRLVIRKGHRPVVRARVAGRKMHLFDVRGANRKLNRKTGVLNLSGGSARLGGQAARRIGNRLGLRGVKSVSAGSRWGKFSVFASRNDSVDPVAETPVEPPVLERPAGAADITSASIKWRVRESFIAYVAVGAGTSFGDGVTADPPEVIDDRAPLVYSFNFPFTDGWSAAESGPAAIHGSGRVGFRQCANTINFTVSDPEIELHGDADSRLIFRVNGTDGTAFPDSRAVMVDLVPSLGTKTVEGSTTTVAGIPGYVPQEATGIFADFYPPYPGDPDDPGAEYSRFGSLTVKYTTG